MRRLMGVLAVLGLVLGVAPEANATLTVTGSNGAVLFQGLVDYTTTTTAGSFPNRESTIIGKTISTLGPSLLNVTYDNPSGDLDFTPPQVGFRWSERILNNTGQTWSGFTVDLLAASGNFSAIENAPYRAAITNCCPPVALNPQVAETSLGTTVTVLPTTVSFSFSVATSVPAGGSLEIYIPIENLPLDSQFQLTETPTVAGAAVSEPGTLFLIGAGLAGLGIFGRRRFFSGADV